MYVFNYSSPSLLLYLHSTMAKKSANATSSSIHTESIEVFGAREHNLKNITQVYQKIQKIKEQITSKTMTVINQRQVTQMLKQNRLSILKSLNKCMVKQNKTYKTLVG